MCLHRVDFILTFHSANDENRVSNLPSKILQVCELTYKRGKMGSRYKLLGKLLWLTAVSLLVVLFTRGAEATGTGYVEEDGQDWGETMEDSNVAVNTGDSDDEVQVGNRVGLVVRHFDLGKHNNNVHKMFVP